MYNIFKNRDEYNVYTSNGTKLKSGDIYIIEDTGSVIFRTNNVDGTLQSYDVNSDSNIMTSIIERNVSSVEIPDGTTIISSAVFYGCPISEIVIPDSVTTIKGNAFGACNKLTSVTIPENVTSIEGSAFAACTNLKYVYVNAVTPPTLAKNNVFDNNATGRKIYVPEQSLNAYKTATNWSTYAADIEAMSL